MGYVKEVFNQHYIDSLNALSLRFSSKLKGGFSGNRRSKAKGASVEYSDFRNYIRGDDIRRIDWNSYARLHKLFIKLFEEEKQATVHIFLDTSSSMDFGEPHKLDFAKVMAASLAYIALNTSDRVHIYTLNEAMDMSIAPVTAKQAFSRLLDFLDQLQPSGGTALNQALAPISNKPMGDGLGILLSDYFDPEGYSRALKTIQYKCGLAYAVQILSPQELKPQLNGGVRLKDQESGLNLDMDIDDNVLNSYLKELEDYNSDLQAFCSDNNITYLLAPTDSFQLQWLNRFV